MNLKSNQITFSTLAIVSLLALGFAFLEIVESLLAPTGGRLFDTMVAGYSLQEFAANTAMLGDRGIAIYLKIIAPLDFIYPLAYVLATWSIWRQLGTSLRPPLPRIGATLMPIAAILDYIENVRLGMLLSGAVVADERSVALTSAATIGKWLFIGIFLALCLAAITARVYRRLARPI